MLKLSWFSPLLPAKTDIAHYTMRLLPALLSRCDLELWTTDKDFDPTISQIAKVNVYDSEQLDWAKLCQTDLIVYNIGNNHEFHQDIWLVSQRCPGLVILHDLKLQGLFTGIYRSNQQREDYLNKMLYYYGADAQIIGRLFEEGQISEKFVVEKFPLTPLALANARGVVCHSRYAYQQLLGINYLPTSYIPLPYAVPTGHSHSSTSRISETIHRLIVFGYLGTNRRLEVILEALASFPRRSEFCLDIYGQVWDADYIQQRIQDLELTELVQIRGFVPEEELEQALDQADLAFNLRYPTMGEASASQLRIWSHSLPSFVTPVGWYEGLSPDTVIPIRLDHELEDIHYHLQGYLDNPDPYKSIGIAGRNRLAEHHSPETCAEQLVEFAQEVLKAPLFPTMQYLMDRTVPEIRKWTPENCPTATLQGLAKAVHFLTY